MQSSRSRGSPRGSASRSAAAATACTSSAAWPHAADAAVAVLVFAATLLTSGGLTPTGPSHHGLGGVLFAVAACGALVARRRWPPREGEPKASQPERKRAAPPAQGVNHRGHQRARDRPAERYSGLLDRKGE